MTSLNLDEKISKKGGWKTWKQLMEKYTESEAEEMIEQGTIQVRGPKRETEGGGGGNRLVSRAGSSSKSCWIV